MLGSLHIYLTGTFGINRSNNIRVSEYHLWCDDVSSLSTSTSTFYSVGKIV